MQNPGCRNRREPASCSCSTLYEESLHLDFAAAYRGGGATASRPSDRPGEVTDKIAIETVYDLCENAIDG